MKNNFNLVLITLVFVVLGCSCPNLKNLISKENSVEKDSPPTVSNSTRKPEKIEATENLSLARYNQIKNGMTYKQVVEIMGAEGTEVSSSSTGKFSTITYKWQNEKFAFVIATFQNEKMMFKSQGGLK